jgi:hypothetical protein
MVFTSAGAFHAVALLLGNYELIARARGLESAMQKLMVARLPATAASLQAANCWSRAACFVSPDLVT